MRKGISPIVAVVLLIAIAVIAAVGLFYWVGGITTKQPTTEKPIVISAQGISCGVKNASVEWATVMVQNLDSYRPVDSELYISSDSWRANYSDPDIAANGGQRELNFTGNFTVGMHYVVYGEQSISQAQFFIPKGLC